MAGRERLHELTDQLPEGDMAAVERMRHALRLPADPEGTGR